MSALERDKFIQKQEFPIFDGTQEYCLWLGCMGGYDPKGREIIADFARVMNYLGTSYGVLRKEKCTGDPVRRLGNDLLFQQLAEANLETLAQNKVKKIVSICPHCVRTIQEDWKEFGTPPEIEHHSEFLARFADKLPPSKSEAPAEKIVFHDPCYLGRYRNVYDEPRTVVALAGEVVEAPRSTSAASAAAPAAASPSSAKKPASASATRAPRNLSPPAQPPSAPPAPSATPCSATRWPPPAKPRRNCSTSPSSPRARLPQIIP